MEEVQGSELIDILARRAAAVDSEGSRIIGYQRKNKMQGQPTCANAVADTPCPPTLRLPRRSGGRNCP